MKSFDDILWLMARGTQCSSFHFMSTQLGDDDVLVRCRLLSDWRRGSAGDEISRYTLTADSPLVSLFHEDDVRNGHRRHHIEPLTGHVDEMFRLGNMVSDRLYADSGSGEHHGSTVLIDAGIVGLCRRTTFHYLPHFSIFDDAECGYPLIDWSFQNAEEFTTSSDHKVRVWEERRCRFFVSDMSLMETERHTTLRHMYAEGRDLARGGEVPIVIMEERGSSTRGVLLFVRNGDEMATSESQLLRRLHYLALMPDAGE